MVSLRLKLVVPSKGNQRVIKGVKHKKQIHLTWGRLAGAFKASTFSTDLQSGEENLQK
jgi:hypothetical protein